MDIKQILLELKKKTQILKKSIKEAEINLTKKDDKDQIEAIKKNIDSSYAE